MDFLVDYLPVMNIGQNALETYYVLFQSGMVWDHPLRQNGQNELGDAHDWNGVWGGFGGVGEHDHICESKNH